MKKHSLYVLALIILFGCDNSQWETIKGSGINDEPKSIEKVIYFENETNGLVGGYTIVEDKNSKNTDGFLFIPTLFLTQDGGKNWKKIKFNSDFRTTVNNAYLDGDTLICQIDSIVLLSTDKGSNFQEIYNSKDKQKLLPKHFYANRYDIKNHNFLFGNNKYKIKELYQNDFATVIVCSGEKILTDYYFASFDNGKSWKYLQDAFGNNKARYLLRDKFLYCYDSEFGLQRLKLK